MNKERQRLEAARDPNTPWKKWGAYLSRRQWGTVREDYNENGKARDYFSHDQAPLRACHWGEDGMVSISDDRQRLSLALALWNGKDPIVKERLFRGQGIAGRLLKHLARIARENGISQPQAEVLLQNKARLAVFARSGLPMKQHCADGVVHVTLALTNSAKSI